jgi:signal transduction histidine kinase
MKLLAALIVTIGVGALLVAEAAMQPSSQDRIVLYSIYGALAVVTALAGWLLARITGRFTSVTAALQLVGVSAVLVAGAAVAVAAGSMFLSSHDLRLVYVSLALGTGLGLALAVTVARSMTADLRELEATTTAIGQGDLSARTGIVRRDEIGSVAAAVDQMAGSLEESRSQRAAAEKSRRVMLASVGHDLRTPLTSIRAALEAIQDGVASDPARYLRSMHSDLDQLSGLVDDIFLMARIEASDLNLEPVALDLAELADDAVASVTPLALQQDVTLELRREGTAQVQADPVALGRVIRNLLDNALRHSPEGGVVTVLVSDAPRPTLTVADQGPGFPPEFREAAFDEFSRSEAARDRVSGGAGLGLAIARGLVHAHQGEIWIPDGQGGRVTLSLPPAEDTQVGADFDPSRAHPVSEVLGPVEPRSDGR